MVTTSEYSVVAAPPLNATTVTVYSPTFEYVYVNVSPICSGVGASSAPWSPK